MSIRKHKNLFHNDEIYPYLPKKNTKDTPSDNKTHQEKTKSQTQCCICYQSSDKITFINCKKGGVQFKNQGRGSACSKDKPICLECRQKCVKSCPFCRNHKLHIIETERYPKKKQPWVIRELERQLKKKKKKEKQNKLLSIRLEWIRNSRPRNILSIPREENIFGEFYSTFDYTLIM